MHVVALAAETKAAQNEGDRIGAKQQLWEARKELADARRLERLVAHVRKGKVVARSQQLKPLEGVSESIAGVASVVREPTKCLQLLGNEYKRKWKAAYAQRVENLTVFGYQLGRDPISIAHAEVRQVFGRMKMKGRLDAHGVSPKALELLFLACPDEFCIWLPNFFK